MFKSLAILAIATLVAAPAFASKQEDLSLTPKCKKAIVEAVTNELGKDDETFSVYGLQLVYGGKGKGKFSHPAVVIAKTSDEVEPRDVLVVTDQNCKVTSIEVLADGLTLDDPEDLDRDL